MTTAYVPGRLDLGAPVRSLVRPRGLARSAGMAAAMAEPAGGGGGRFEPLEPRQMLAADLTVGFSFSQQQPAIFAPGATISNVLVTLANGGDTATDFAALRAVLSLNQTFGDGDDIVLGDFVADPLAPGGQTDTAQSFAIPTSTAAGSYFLLVAADPDNQVVEDDDANNFAATATASIVVAGAPVFADLQTSLGPVSGTFVPGQEIPVSFTIRNTGSAAADNFTTRIVLSRNNIFGDGDDISLENVPEQGNGGVLPGEAFTDTGGVLLIPEVIASGAYFLLAKIDVNDQVAESNETNNIYRSAAASIVIAPPPTVTIAATDNTAGETNPNFGRFTVTRSGATTLSLSVNLIIGGTATSGDDYQSLATMVTFLPGQASVSFDLTAIDDALVEPSETVVVSLEAGTRYQLNPALSSATVTIVDNEATVSVVATRPTASETAGVNSTALLTFTRGSGSITGPLTVFYALQGGGTATSGVDFEVLSGSVTFAAGSATATVTITAIDDAQVENTEGLSIAISANTAYRISATQNTAAVSITDNEPTVTIAATQPGQEGGLPAVFTFTRSGGTTTGELTVNFQYNLPTTTATPGPDFTAPQVFSAVFAAGSATATVSIPVADDSIVEATETLGFVLVASASYRLGAATVATVNILDNEPTVTVTAGDASASENPGDTGTFVFRRTGGSTTGALTVRYTVASTAAGSDFTSSIGLFGTIQFDPGQTEFTITITPNDDFVVESAETVTLTVTPDITFSLPAGGSSATVTINDNEPTITITAVDASASENAGDVGTFVFRRAGGSSAGALTVQYSASATASAQDYTPSSPLFGTVQFGAGETEVTITITAIDDALAEPDETITLSMIASTAYNLPAGGSSATVTIRDNEPIVTVTALDGSASETAGDTGRLVFRRASGSSAGALTVQYVLSGSAIAGDYTPSIALAGSVQFAPGQTEVSVTLTPVDDAIAEPDETLIVTMSAGAAYNLPAGGSSATVTIRDNEPIVTVTAIDATASETAGDTGRLVFRRASGSSAGALTVQYVLSGSAIAGDYTPSIALAGSVQFAPGQTEVSVTLTPVDDAIAEPDETLIVTMSAGAAYNLPAGGSSATVTIRDNEPFVSVTATGPTAAEGGAAPLRFTLTRTGPTTAPMVVTFTLAGTAAAGSDFTAPAGLTATIPAGAASVVVSITPTDDVLVEPTETVILQVAAGGSYRVSPTLGSASATITDNEPTVSVVVTDAAAGEALVAGQPNVGRATFTRTGALGSALTVNYVLLGSATAGTDYAQPTGTITFAAGSATAILTITPTQDQIGDAGETVIVQLGLGVGYRIDPVPTRASATITIADDEPVVSIVASAPAAAETGAAAGRWTVTRTGPTTSALIVNYTVSGSASSGADFTALSGSVTIPAGALSATITVTPIDDQLVESPETVIVTIAADSAYNISAMQGAGTVTIADNEPTLAVRASDPQASEAGDPGRFLVTRTGPTNQALTVHYQVGLTGTATNGVDFAVLSGTVVIPIGALSAEIVLTPTQDTLGEGVETAVLTLQADNAYRLPAATSATITITDDEPVVTLVGVRVSTSEGAGAAALLTATRTGTGLSQAVTVSFTLAGSAILGDDYTVSTPVAGQITIPAGAATAQFTIVGVQDTLGESAETVVVTLAAGSGYSIGVAASVSVAITDDEPTVTVSTPDPAAGETGNNTGRFLFTRSGGTQSALTVTYVLEGSATEGDDFQTIAVHSVVIPAGQLTASVTITPTDDALGEGPETVVLLATGNAGYRAVNPVAALRTVTIADSEPVVTVVAADPRALEPGVGAADTARFTFTRAGPTSQALTVTYALSGSASGADYSVSSPASITFGVGQTTATLTLTALADLLAESDETVVLMLTGNSGYQVSGAQGQATATIGANGPTVSVLASDPSAAEVASGVANPGRFTITRVGGTTAALTVTYHFEGTATAGADFTTPALTVEFAAGQLTRTVDLAVLDDAIGEAAETVILVLDAQPEYRVVAAQAQATVTIADNEPVVSVTAADPAASELASNPGSFTITRVGPLTAALTVQYTIGGTATSGADYQALSGTAVIPAGQASITLAVAALADTAVETPETVVLTLATASGYRVTPDPLRQAATVTIADAPQTDLAITGVTFDPATFSLTSPGQRLDVVVDYGNLGLLGASASLLEFRLSADDIFGNADDIVLGVSSLGALSGLATGQLSISLLFDAAAPRPTPGSYRLAARIDSGRRVIESSESNNDFIAGQANIVITN